MVTELRFTDLPHQNAFEIDGIWKRLANHAALWRRTDRVAGWALILGITSIIAVLLHIAGVIGG